MAVADILNTEVVVDKAEEDREPSMDPKARSGGALLATMLV